MSSSSSAIIKSLWWRQGLRVLTFTWLFAPGTASCFLSRVCGLCVFFLFLQVFFFLSEMLPISAASTVEPVLGG